LPDPTPDIFAAPYLDICPPGLQGTEPNPWTTIYPLRPSPGEIEPHAAVELDLSALPHPDTIYLTLGTIMNQTPKVFRALIDPQAAVPPHCRAVASHAGAGTMLGALCYGLPQLCLPQGTDQPSNTAALVPTGAALALQPDEIADAVAEALGRLLNEPSFRQAANRLRAEIERMPTAAAVLHEVLVATDQ
jgi:hypothetical protein